jgi:hypothetical protein
MDEEGSLLDGMSNASSSFISPENTAFMAEKSSYPSKSTLANNVDPV